MTGPEHYREAERLNQQAYHYVYGDGADPVVGAAFAAMAQVHATLAQAAATVATRAFGPQERWGGHTIEVNAEWREATGD